MSGIGVILNPYSRSNKKNPERIKQFGFIVGDRGSCHATESLDQVRDLAREFKERGVEILCISGGDGTNHRTLTTFIEVYKEVPLPKIALLRGGTMNNLAWQMGIRGNPENILSNLILKYHHGEPIRETKMNMIEVNGMYGFLFGMGVVERFIRIYQDAGSGGPTPLRGLYLLIRATISALMNGKFARHICERFNANLYLDGKKAPFKNYMMLLAGNMRTLGFYFRPLYRGATEEGKFQAVCISASGRQLFYTFPMALLEKPAHSEHYVDEMASNMVLEFDKPMYYTVDGDTCEAPVDRVEIKTGPLLTFVIP